MRTLRNLRLSVRLGGAFGLVALLLLATSVLSASRLGVVQSRVDQLSERTLRAQTLLSEMNDATLVSAGETARHLYVYDGDLKQQDAVARTVADQIAIGDADAPKVAALVKGTSAAPGVAAANVARGRFLAHVQKAIKLSRRETVSGTENRDGSRNYYVDNV